MRAEAGRTLGHTPMLVVDAEESIFAVCTKYNTNIISSTLHLAPSHDGVVDAERRLL